MTNQPPGVRNFQEVVDHLTPLDAERPDRIFASIEVPSQMHQHPDGTISMLACYDTTERNLPAIPANVPKEAKGIYAGDIKTVIRCDGMPGTRHELMLRIRWTDLAGTVSHGYAKPAPIEFPAGKFPSATIAWDQPLILPFPLLERMRDGNIVNGYLAIEVAAGNTIIASRRIKIIFRLGARP